MFCDMNFDAAGLERMDICRDAEKPFDFKKLTHEQKVIYVKGMQAGYYQGQKELAQKTINAFSELIVRFKP